MILCALYAYLHEANEDDYYYFHYYGQCQAEQS